MRIRTKNLIKRTLLIGLAAFLALIVVDVIITEVDAHKIPHHFASAKEGRELLASNTEYYSKFTQNDIDYRLNRSGATLDDMIQASSDEIKSFNIFEKYIMDRTIAKMVRKLDKNGYDLPDVEEITYVKSSMNTEGVSASGYTHGSTIYLSSTNILLSAIPGGGDYFEHLMWHELFHCLTRNNPDFRADVYSLINFTVEDHDFEIPSCLKEKMYSNPDVEHHDSHTTFVIDGQETECFLVWIVTEDFSGSNSNMVTDVALVPIDGTDTYYTREQASNFSEVFGANSDYVTDPEEFMADNFADAMEYGTEGRNGQGYADPEIIRGIIDIVRR